MTASNKESRARTARETLEIIRSGYYYNYAGEKVDLTGEIKTAVNRTRLYHPDELVQIDKKIQDNITHYKHNRWQNMQETELEVVNETTLSAAKRLYEQNYDAVCLNFASARNPGGGFLKGSGAQEESLARASALYATLKQQPHYYRANKNYDSALYTDHMIYSPRVPVFRNDKDELLNQPYETSFITAPAVNAGVVQAQEPENIPYIADTMRHRIHLILSLASYQGHDAIVLGAFGCGVFKNDPEEVAGYFTECFYNEMGTLDGYSFLFPLVTFAVLDRSKTKATHNIFKRKLLRG